MGSVSHGLSQRLSGMIVFLLIKTVLIFLSIHEKKKSTMAEQPEPRHQYRMWD